jgi:hypothetical protein
MWLSFQYISCTAIICRFKGGFFSEGKIIRFLIKNATQGLLGSLAWILKGERQEEEKTKGETLARLSGRIYRPP